MKYLLMILGVGFLGIAPSYANPCDNDVDTMCDQVQPGTGGIADCLRTHEEELSHPCREWIKKMDQSLKHLKSVCGDATREYCRDVRPGYKRVKNCLMDNFDKLPPECQRALK